MYLNIKNIHTNLKYIYTLLIGAACSTGVVFSQQSGNPVISHIPTMDPAAMVENDTLFIFTGHEETEKPYNWPFRAKDWHVFSTVDMENYTDHGAILSPEVFSWLDEDYCWASHCVKKDSLYYWYVCNFGNIGVAVSEDILGPYVDPVGKPIIDRKMPGHDMNNIDPCVFIDDDGSPYIYWGGQGRLKISRLKDNMIEIEGDAIEITGLKNFEEAPWVFKRNDIYYLAYSASNGYKRGPIRYAVSSSPMGPWIDQKDILGPAYNSFTNHEAIIDYKDQWYMIYHNGALPGGGDYKRSVCIDKLYFNPDGSIQFVEQTTGGPNGKNEYNNFGPHPYAGVDATAALPFPVKMNSRVIDDGRSTKLLEWSWSVVKGEGEISIPNNPNLDALIYFSKPGDYILELKASDGYREVSDQVTVKVFPEVVGDDYEAEDSANVFVKATVMDNVTCSGSKVVGYMGKESALIFNNIRVNRGGAYSLSFYYSTSGRDKHVDLKVKSKDQLIHFPVTANGYSNSFAIKTIIVELQRGVNSIELRGQNGIPTIDKVVVGDSIQEYKL